MIRRDRFDFKLPSLPEDPTDLEQFINRSERVLPLKEDNASRIVWNDPGVKQPTPYSLVYLHGFTASQGEGAPLHRHFAERYGCNLFLSRLAGHGLREHAMSNFTLENLIDSAVFAYSAGRAIGDNVILMGTSTGASLALLLASRLPNIHSVITYSPLIRLRSRRARWISYPVVNEIAVHLFRLHTIHNYSKDERESMYWYQNYPAESLKTLNRLLYGYMNPTVFGQIRQPFFMGYYYKDKLHQDETVSVKSMLAMFSELGTDREKKRKMAFPEAGSHVICSPLTSKSFNKVEQATFAFTEKIAGLNAIKGDY